MFAVDERGARDQADSGDLLQWNLRHGVGRRILRADRQPVDGLDALPIGLGEPHDDREVPIAALFIRVSGGLPTDRCLDRRVDIAGGEPVAPGGKAVDVDADGRLAERTKRRKIGDTRYGLHHRFDLIGRLRERLKIAAK